MKECIKEKESEKVRVTFPARAKGLLSAPQHSQGDEVRQLCVCIGMSGVQHITIKILGVTI